MRPIYIMLYSGGVESVLTLKKVVEDGITPFIFHFQTLKLKQKHERMIRKTARILSPDSPFYVFDTETINYVALWYPDDPYHYGVEIREGWEFIPLKHGDFLIAGYTRYIYRYDENHRRYRPRHADVFHYLEIKDTPFIFPLLDFTRKQLDEKFRRLPLTIRQNTVSTTRGYDYGGGIFVHECDIKECLACYLVEEIKGEIKV